MNENDIRTLLRQNPGMAYITPDSTKLYALDIESDYMYCWTGDFSTMSAKRVNEFIQDWLK